MIHLGLLLLAFVAVSSANQSAIHKVCVPKRVLEACNQMKADAKNSGLHIECVSARDRLDCLYKVKDHEADFEAVEPEDMFIAAGLDDSAFTVFKEIRTKEEPNAAERYEAVAVIRNDVNINSVKDLKGLKSCHTGVGRNVGYKIPITKLTKMGILGPLSDTSLSPRENELKALSQFFSKSCLVGTWSAHPETNAKLKQTYSNLCELCEDPQKCDYPDQNSGYDGALRCLATAGGQVAFTKVIFVKKFFGMAYGNQPAKPNSYNPEEYSYLCPDGTKKPITGPACTWAARPWPGYMASTHVSADEIKQLKAELQTLNNIGVQTHAEWLAKVLLINDKTVAVDNTPSSPLQYLERAKYKDVIERDVLAPRREVRICTTNSQEMAKCEMLKLAAYSRDIRPSLSCVKSSNCFHALHNKEAELFVVDAHKAVSAESHHSKAIMNEKYNNESKQYIVAAVSKSSSIDSLEKLRGKKACMPENDTAGFFGVLKYLLKKNFIPKAHCPYETTLTEFFSSIEASSDPLKCLGEGKGDVAFVPLASLYQNGHDDIRVLCPGGGKAAIDKTECGLISIPPRMILTCKDLSDVQIDEARQSLLSAGNLYAKSPELFQLFGRFNGQPNVLFSDHANGLAAITDSLPAFDEYKKLVADLTSCNA